MALSAPTLGPGISRPSGIASRFAMADEVPLAMDRIRAAEMIAALSLATDLGIAVPLEHGLQSTLLAMRLADRLKVDAETAVQTYYACQLFYIGCTANADVPAELFGADDASATYASPSRFGSRAEMTAGFFRGSAARRHANHPRSSARTGRSSTRQGRQASHR